MQYQVELRPDALKFIKSVDESEKRKIKHIFAKISQNPSQYQAKYGEFRIFFSINCIMKIVKVIDIKNRQDAYRNL